MSIGRELARTTDNFLSALLLAEKTPEPFARGTHLEGFRNLWGCDFHLVDQIAEKMEGGARYYLVADAREQANATWPIDVATCIDKHDHLFFLRVASAEPKDLRGKVKLCPPKCVTYTQGALCEGQWFAKTEIWGLLAGRWIPLEEGIGGASVTNLRGDTVQTMQHIDRESREQGHRNIELAFGAALTERYSWHVAFGFSDSGPRLVLPTNPAGCLRLFRKRWLDPGETRRSALKHWVNEHFRENVEQETLDYVREHLRGNTRFIWNGVDCELMVSAYDLEKNEFFRQQAAEWRAARKHNRVRLRLKEIRAR